MRYITQYFLARGAELANFCFIIRPLSSVPIDCAVNIHENQP